MRKTLIYTVDALSPQLLQETLKKDIEDDTIKEIIVPVFILKAANNQYQNFSKIMNELQYCSKIQIKDFPVLYSENYCHFDYLILFVIHYSKYYRNLYIRTRDNQIIIACLKRGFKVFIDKDDDVLFKNINSENYLFPNTNTVFFDTCYYCNMFKSYIGLNILKDKKYKKIIISGILEELVKINEFEIFETLVYLLNQRKEYNIEFIISEKAYTEPYFYNDLSFLSYIMQLNSTKYKDDITVYTCDIEFTMQCMALKIKTSSNIVFDKEINLNKNLSNITTKKSSTKSQIEVPIFIKNDNTYVSITDVPIVYKDIASGIYSNILNKNSIKYYQIKNGYYVKIKNEKNAFRISKIDIELAIANLEKTNLVL